MMDYAALLDRIRAIVTTEDDSPEGEMGPRWIVGQIRDLIAEAATQAGQHPDGCHTMAPGARDCESDGHYSCATCSRRAEDK